MQTLQPTLRLGRDVWDSAGMPVEEFQSRVSALRSAMAREGMDALLLYGSSLDDCGYPTYISNYTTKLPFGALVILPRDGDPVLMFQGSTRGQSAAQATTWIQDSRPCWDIAATCITALAEKKLSAATLGLAGIRRLMPYDQWQKLSAALGSATFADAEPMVDRLRAVKSDREMARVRNASRIIRGALDGLEAIGSPAVNELQLAARLMHDARIQGAEDVRVLIARPAESRWSFRPPEDSAFAEDETIVIHMAASWERYWSESIRTYAIQDGGLRACCSEAQERQFQNIVASLRPGRALSEFSEFAAREIGSANVALIEEYGVGHGIGVTPREWPVISLQPDFPHSRVVVERGMCISIRLALRDARSGFVIRGETVIVNDL